MKGLCPDTIWDWVRFLDRKWRSRWRDNLLYRNGPQTPYDWLSTFMASYICEYAFEYSVTQKIDQEQP